MNKERIKLLLMAALVCSLSFSLSSCKDDDADENVTEQRNADASPTDTDEARTAFRWLCALTDATTLDDDWQTKTYDVTAGQPSDDNPMVRILVVSDLDEAKMSFSRLADLSPEELSAKQTVSGGAAGTMTWTPSAEGAKNLAEVSVSSRILPRLQKIVYCTKEQTGQNGWLWDSMKGTAFYRLGDVVRDPEGYYWVCVRPSFAPDNKKSHWINIFNASESGGGKEIPTANIYSKYNNSAGYQNQTILLPTKLSYDREHIYNLANLLWALLDIDGYKNKCLANGNKGLGGFDYTYHGEKFLKAVRSYWDRADNRGYTIWEKLFNRTRDELENHTEQISFLYQGYSWTWGNTGYVWRYKSDGYQPKYSGKESEDKEKYDFVADGFDVRNFASQPMSVEKPFEQFQSVGGGFCSCTWVVRHKTGDELTSSGSYSPYYGIATRDGFMTDVYRYNYEKNIAAGENVPQETEDKFVVPEYEEVIVDPGTIVGADFKFYNNVADAVGAGTTPIAIVVYRQKRVTSVPVEYGSGYNTLAMALTDAADQQWATESSFDICCSRDTENDFLTYVDGAKWTEKMAFGCGLAGHTHGAARACRQYSPEGFDDDLRMEAGFSNWFLPSAGQWVTAIVGMGLDWSDDTGAFIETVTGQGFNTVSNFFAQSGAGRYAPQGLYWACTDRDDDTAVYLRLNDGSRVMFSDEYDEGALKTKVHKVRPFIAFYTE